MKLTNAEKKHLDKMKRQLKAEKAEKKRKAEIERLRKRTELFSAQARERESLARRRRASREARHEHEGRYILRKIGKSTKKVGKSLTRKRDKSSKIGWI